MPRPPVGGSAALLVAASAMSAGPPAGVANGSRAGGGVAPAPGAANGSPGAAGATGAAGAGASGRRAGATAVLGNWLPPDIRAVGASAPTAGGGVSSSSVPDSGGANTVAGSGTEPLSSSEAFASAHGARGGTPSDAVGSCSGPPVPALGHEAPDDEPGSHGADWSDELPAACDAFADGTAEGTAGEAAAATGAAGAAPGWGDDEDSADAPSLRASGIPSLSAASCNHSGGLSKNDV